MIRTKRLIIVVLAIYLLTTYIPGPASSAPPAGPSTAALTDPFAYCAAVGTVDKPDARYTGGPVPDEVVTGFKKAAGLEASTEPMEMLRQTTIWRCMGGKVYACNFGANLPCDSKANTNKEPTQAMSDYCAANPGSDFLPMSLTGHDTIYSWRCANSTAEVVEQIAKVDDAGYLQQIWYLLPPSP
jgi:hypothetical protein